MSMMFPNVSNFAPFLMWQLYVLHPVLPHCAYRHAYVQVNFERADTRKAAVLPTQKNDDELASFLDELLISVVGWTITLVILLLGQCQLNLLTSHETHIRLKMV